ncbi:NfeD family protein [Tessaracoccus antarcticus]|uniref:NfeD family protein n=1 Tax=Tessaracoccus antarcticus TaxID=2479848 RepID=A0A3M0GRF2_9ACTN|nr:NfeD family protein [Tessaracoccus antarcticus]RMB59856.1 NfeD family protein [Tessaracoccus antarcticus]
MWWLAWLIAAVALGVAEAFSLTLAFGIFSAAALLAAVVAGFDAPWILQLLSFAAASMLGLLVVRPIALRHASQPALTRDGTDALVGRTATVLEEISAEHGLIHLSGEDWTARSLDDQLIIPPGAAVDVMEIQGATAIVYPRELLP